MHLTSQSPAIASTTIAADIAAYKMNLLCRDLAAPGIAGEWEIANRTDTITSMLADIRQRATARGIENLRIVAEPTGRYHKLLFRIARSMGFETALVDAGHVEKMRVVVFGDEGKTDERDPYAILAVADQGRLIADRSHNETFQLLRHWGALYHVAEEALIEAKSRVHAALTMLFPDFDFSTDFLYGPSGQAIVRCFGLNPHSIAASNTSRIYDRLCKHSNIRRSSVVRLLTQARITVSAISRSRITDLQAREFSLAWEDFERASERRATARAALEALYDEARLADPLLPDTSTGVISQVALARFLGETGPLSGYSSCQQLLRMGGINLRERKSGTYIGQTKITRRGRPLYRSIVNQIALPLVKRDRLYGAYYHHKTGVQRMPGKKAMTAVGRKIVKLIWGWYRSGAAFDAARVFTCESDYRAAA